MSDTKVVPREPTAEMIEAGSCADTRQYPDPRDARKVWRAMYDAAPSAPAPDVDALIKRLREAVALVDADKWPGMETVNNLMDEAADALASAAQRDTNERCIHGVWAADHCYQCQRATEASPPSQDAPKPETKEDIEQRLLRSEGVTVGMVVQRAAPKPDDAVDARRYRWLRLRKFAEIGMQWLLPDEARSVDTPEQIDAAIDAAMRKGE
jgi:hypothetical protein